MIIKVWEEGTIFELRQIWVRSISNCGIAALRVRAIAIVTTATDSGKTKTICSYDMMMARRCFSILVSVGFCFEFERQRSK